MNKLFIMTTLAILHVAAYACEKCNPEIENKTLKQQIQTLNTKGDIQSQIKNAINQLRSKGMDKEADMAQEKLNQLFGANGIQLPNDAKVSFSNTKKEAPQRKRNIPADKIITIDANKGDIQSQIKNALNQLRSKGMDKEADMAQEKLNQLFGANGIQLPNDAKFSFSNTKKEAPQRKRNIPADKIITIDANKGDIQSQIKNALNQLRSKGMDKEADMAQEKLNQLFGANGIQLPNDAKFSFSNTKKEAPQRKRNIPADKIITIDANKGDIQSQIKNALNQLRSKGMDKEADMAQEKLNQLFGANGIQLPNDAKVSFSDNCNKRRKRMPNLNSDDCKISIHNNRDKFNRIIADKSFQKLLDKDGVQVYMQAIQNASFPNCNKGRRLMSNLNIDDFEISIHNNRDKFNRIIADKSFQKLLDKDGVQVYMKAIQNASFPNCNKGRRLMSNLNIDDFEISSHNDHARFQRDIAGKDVQKLLDKDGVQVYMEEIKDSSSFAEQIAQLTKDGKYQEAKNLLDQQIKQQNKAQDLHQRKVRLIEQRLNKLNNETRSLQQELRKLERSYNN